MTPTSFLKETCLSMSPSVSLSKKKTTRGQAWHYDAEYLFYHENRHNTLFLRTSLWITNVHEIQMMVQKPWFPVPSLSPSINFNPSMDK